jgi:ATP-dependent DNA helicase PIF1
VSDKPTGWVFFSGARRIATACAGSGVFNFSPCSSMQILTLSYFTGIAAMNMPHGRTAHLTFGITPVIHQNSVSSIAKHSQKADVLKKATLIMWDETPMTHQHALESVDRLLKYLMDSNLPFGGKGVVLGGDFFQVLLVVRKGSHPQIVNARIVNSNCWSYFQRNVFCLSVNMRASGDPNFQKFL